MTDKAIEEGLAIRREVLGKDHVDRAMAHTDDFIGPLQDLVTGVGWGAFWSRPGLDRKTRSLITIALLASLNRHHELRAHLRGAINNGASREEIREALIHVIPYCGFPAGIDAFRTAKDLFESIDGEKTS